MLQFILDYFIDFFNLILPNSCLSCDKILDEEEKYLCDKCFLELKLTNYHLDKYNELYVKLFKKTDIKMAFSYLFYIKDNPIQELIHSMKYKNRSKIALYLGELYGKILRIDLDFIHFDLIIPIPLHNNRKKTRGYNQSEYICLGLNKYLNSIVDTKSVIRKKNTNSLTLKGSEDREKEIKNAFEILKPENLKDKNILLVDDIITTGSTISECANEIKKNVSCNIYVCSIARTKDL